jgi:hypothetical protein
VQLGFGAMDEGENKTKGSISRKVVLISLGNIAHPSLSEPVEPRRPTKYNVGALYFSGGALYVSG